jgi:hypothetical protein
VRWPLILTASTLVPMNRDDVTSKGGQPQPQRYEISVRGHLGETMRFAFPGLQARPRGGDTALHGVLAEIEALGLDLLEVRRLPPI